MTTEHVGDQRTTSEPSANDRYSRLWSDWRFARETLSLKCDRWTSNARETASALFMLGWATRNGDFDQEALFRASARALDKLSADEGARPMLGQRVDYHGSKRHLWGWYWVTGVRRELDPEGRPERFYDLSRETYSGMDRVLRKVRRCSVTPMNVFYQR